MTDVLVHVVLFKFHRETSPAQREELLAKLRLLGRQSGGEEAGILFWQVDQNGDQRKNWHLVELAVFGTAPHWKTSAPIPRMMLSDGK